MSPDSELFAARIRGSRANAGCPILLPKPNSKPIRGTPGAQANFEPLVFVSNAAAAFALNVSVFLLVGSTSALTMNVAGVLKDWLLIGLSVAIFKAQARKLAQDKPQ